MTDWTRQIATLQAWCTTAWRHARAAAGFPLQLRCREVVDLFLPYVEQTLDPQTRHAVARHLADCENCGRFLETYRATMALGHQLRDEAMPPGLLPSAPPLSYGRRAGARGCSSPLPRTHGRRVRQRHSPHAPVAHHRRPRLGVTPHRCAACLVLVVSPGRVSVLRAPRHTLSRSPQVRAPLQITHVGVSLHDELPCHRGGGAASHRCGQALAPSVGISGTASMSTYDQGGREAAARG